MYGANIMSSLPLSSSMQKSEPSLFSRRPMMPYFSRLTMPPSFTAAEIPYPAPRHEARVGPSRNSLMKSSSTASILDCVPPFFVSFERQRATLDWTCSMMDPSDTTMPSFFLQSDAAIVFGTFSGLSGRTHTTFTCPVLSTDSNCGRKCVMASSD